LSFWFVQANERMNHRMKRMGRVTSIGRIVRTRREGEGNCRKSGHPLRSGECRHIESLDLSPLSISVI
jgi:hypothetical protein